MGGGGGSSRSIGDIQSLLKTAKEELQKGNQSGKRNVFISFANEDINTVNLLRGQAKNDNSPIEFNDWSLREPFDSKRADYIKKGIRERIERSSVTVVYVSEHTASSKWVDWEIRESIRLGKGVVAVHKGESPPRRLPDAVVEHKVSVIQWTQTGVAAAIQKVSGDR